MSNIKVFSQVGEQPKVIPNKCGTGVIPVMKYVVNKTTGMKEYKKVGETNLDEIIQSATKGCDMNFIVEHILKGDNSVLMAKNGVYLDTRNLPKDIIEAGEFSEHISDIYNNSVMLKEIYASVDDYRKDFLAGVDISAKVNDLYNKKIAILNAQKIASEKKVDSEVKK